MSLGRLHPNHQIRFRRVVARVVGDGLGSPERRRIQHLRVMPNLMPIRLCFVAIDFFVFVDYLVFVVVARWTFLLAALQYATSLFFIDVDLTYSFL